ncbi:hypothetical protein NUW58_g1033 [Xylaria curta]|uniref:Uncharacterized protein n=1 Tax=Xylaria curta TaxID=42375 RepID=A0ACC1PPQ0_9PEZI|nr:hypothetical protein NUW58_g1033 [Xylaria curta]
MAANADENKKPTVWVEGMQMPRGKRHDSRFQERITGDPGRLVGQGTLEDPQIKWLVDNLDVSVDVYEATEMIVRQQLRKYRLRFAWIVAHGHGISTVRYTKDGRIMSDDDNHITLRMGSTAGICNIHGHFYMIYEGNDVRKRPIRMMEIDERSIIGGYNPQLWAMGPYPSHLQRTDIKYPETPFEIKPGSIMDQLMQAKRTQEDECCW